MPYLPRVQPTEKPFAAADIGAGVVDVLARARYGWLTTVGPSGLPVPVLDWFHFDGRTVIVYSEPDAARITHIFERPEVSLHLDSDGLGDGVVVLGGRAAVTAEGANPRDDHPYWAKYHVEAEARGLTAHVSNLSTRITITPTVVWTTLAT